MKATVRKILDEKLSQLVNSRPAGLRNRIVHRRPKKVDWFERNDFSNDEMAFAVELTTRDPEMSERLRHILEVLIKRLRNQEILGTPASHGHVLRSK